MTVDDDGVAGLLHAHTHAEDRAAGAGSTNLLLGVIPCRVPESRVCLLYSLYQGNIKSPITEEFTYFNSGEWLCVFTGLDAREVSSDSFLVVKAFALRKLESGEDVRVGLACGVLELTPLDQYGKMTRTVRLFQHADFARVLPTLLSRSEAELAPYAEVEVSVDKTQYDLTHPSLQSAVRCATVRKGETLQYDAERNDVYVTLKEGTLRQMRGSYDVMVQVRDNLQHVVPNAIALGSETFPETATTLVVSGERPRFGETFRVRLPKETVYTAHLFLYVRAPGTAAPVAAGWLPLYANNGLVEDADHLVELFRGMPMQSMYLQQAPGDAYRKGDTLLVATVSFSLIPHSPVITGLLWDAGSFGHSFRGVDSIDADEKAYFAVDIANGLFATLDAVPRPLDPLCYQIFGVLVKLVAELTDPKQRRRYDVLRERLEGYIDGAMGYLNVHEHLAALLEQFAKGADPGLPAVNTLKSLPMLYRIIFASRSRFLAENGYPGDLSTDADFKARMVGVTLQVISMMAPGNPNAVNARGLLLRNFDQAVGVLARYCDADAVAMVFWSACEYFGDERKRLKDKVAFVAHVLGEPRVAVTPDLIAHLLPLYEAHGPVYAVVVARVADFAYASRESPALRPFIVQTLAHLLPLVLRDMRDMRADDGAPAAQPGAGLEDTFRTMSAALVSMLATCAALGALDGIVRQLGAERQQEVLGNLCALLSELARSPPFPRRWVFLDAFWRHAAAQVAAAVAPLLVSRAGLLDGAAGAAEVALWSDYFAFCLTMISDFAAPDLSRYRLDACLVQRACADLPCAVLPCVVRVWDAVRDKGPFVETERCALLLLRQGRPELSEFATRAYVELVRGDYALHRTVDKSVLCTFVPVEQMVRRRQLRPEAVADFMERQVFPRLGDLDQGAVAALKSAVQEILTRLTNFATLPEGDAFQDDRFFEMLRLVKYYRETSRETFMDIVHSIFAAQERADNFLEAGNAVLLHARELPYTKRVLRPFASEARTLPAQTAAERKTLLCNMAIDCYDRAKCYDRAVALLKEVIARLSTDKQNLHHVVKLLGKEGIFYEKRAAGQGAPPPAYFYVAFRGPGFPPALRGKDFVFRTKGGEDRSVLAARLAQKAAGVQFVQRQEQARDPHANYAVCYPVYPVYDDAQFVAHGYTPDRDVCTFTDVPGRAERRTVYTTVDTFPFVLKHSQVVAAEQTTLDPLQLESDALAASIDRLYELQDACMGAKGANAQAALQLELTNCLRRYAAPHGLAQMKRQLFVSGNYPRGRTDLLQRKLRMLAECLGSAVQLLTNVSIEDMRAQVDALAAQVDALYTADAADGAPPAGTAPPCQGGADAAVPPTLSARTSAGRATRTMSVVGVPGIEVAPRLSGGAAARGSQATVGALNRPQLRASFSAQPPQVHPHPHSHPQPQPQPQPPTPCPPTAPSRGGVLTQSASFSGMSSLPSPVSHPLPQQQQQQQQQHMRSTSTLSSGTRPGMAPAVGLAPRSSVGGAPLSVPGNPPLRSTASSFQQPSPRPAPLGRQLRASCAPPHAPPSVPSQGLPLMAPRLDFQRQQGGYAPQGGYNLQQQQQQRQGGENGGYGQQQQQQQQQQQLSYRGQTNGKNATLHVAPQGANGPPPGLARRAMSISVNAGHGAPFGVPPGLRNSTSSFSPSGTRGGQPQPPSVMRGAPQSRYY